MTFDEYNKLSLGVDCVIFSTDVYHAESKNKDGMRALQVLLLKRNIEPYDGMWSIPGGLVDDDKGLIETLDSKLFKKTSINNLYKKQLHTYGDDINRDPRGRVVSVAYMALGTKERFSEIKETTYGEVKWFWVGLDANNNLYVIDPESGSPIKNLAFDHAQILKDAVERLRYEIITEHVALEMMPKLFTIRELQDVYENVLNRPMYSFRRIVEKVIEETEEKVENKAHRPAKLYTRRSKA